jgi:hypothetical protein
MKCEIEHSSRKLSVPSEAGYSTLAGRMIDAVKELETDPPAFTVPVFISEGKRIMGFHTQTLDLINYHDTRRLYPASAWLLSTLMQTRTPLPKETLLRLYADYHGEYSDEISGRPNLYVMVCELRKCINQLAPQEGDNLIQNNRHSYAFNHEYAGVSPEEFYQPAWEMMKELTLTKTKPEKFILEKTGQNRKSGFPETLVIARQNQVSYTINLSDSDLPAENQSGNIRSLQIPGLSRQILFMYLISERGRTITTQMIRTANLTICRTVLTDQAIYMAFADIRKALDQTDPSGFLKSLIQTTARGYRFNIEASGLLPEKNDPS